MRGRAKQTGSPCMPQASTLHLSKAAGLSQSFSNVVCCCLALGLIGLIMYMKKIARF